MAKAQLRKGAPSLMQVDTLVAPGYLANSSQGPMVCHAVGVPY